MYAAINKGITNASGTFLSYLNADDLYLPWAVECAVTALTSGSADLAFGDVLIMTRHEGHPTGVWLQFYPPFDPRVYTHEVVMGQPSVFWTRKVVDRIGGFDETLEYCGDLEYWARAGAAGLRYERLAEVLAVEVRHEGTLSSNYPHRLRSELAAVRDRYRQTVRPRAIPPPLKSLTHRLRWRGSLLAFSLNYSRTRPRRWRFAIPFLKRAGVRVQAKDVARLMMPMRLGGTWSFWSADPSQVERALIREFLERMQTAHDEHGNGGDTGT
jgi:hypothetical protein